MKQKYQDALREIAEQIRLLRTADGQLRVAQSLLEDMWVLARDAAQDDCTDAERAELQQMLSQLRRELEKTVGEYRGTEKQAIARWGKSYRRLDLKI